MPQLFLQVPAFFGESVPDFLHSDFSPFFMEKNPVGKTTFFSIFMEKNLAKSNIFLHVSGVISWLSGWIYAFNLR